MMATAKYFVVFLAVVTNPIFSEKQQEKKEDRRFISTSVNMPLLGKQLLEPMYVMFKAAVKAANSGLPNRMMKKEARVGTCCGIGNFGARAEIRLFDFALDKLESLEQQMKVETTPRRYSKDGRSRSAVRFHSSGSDLRMVSGVRAAVGMAALVPLDCEVRAKTDLRMHEYSIRFDMDAEGNSFRVAEINPGQMTMSVVPVFKGATCEIVSGFVRDVFKTLANELTTMFRNVFTPLMNDHLRELINDKLEFLSPEKMNFDLEALLPGSLLSMTPRLDAFVSQDRTADLRASFDLEARASRPNWRRGSDTSFRYEEWDAADGDTAPPLPSPGADHAFNLHLGAPAINEVVANVFYLVWNFLVADDDPVSERSSLCTDRPSLSTDPCPFPPARTTLQAFDKAKFWMIFAIFPFQLFTKFDLLTVLPPPRMIFHDGGMSGSAALSLLVQGRDPLNCQSDVDDNRTTTVAPTELFEFNGRLVINGSLPSLDVETGRVTALTLDALYVDDITIRFHRAPLFSGATSLLTNLFFDVLETVTTSLLKTINDGLNNVLSDVASLLLPTLDHFPVVATAVSFFLPVGGVRAHGRTNETASYLELFGDLGLRTIYHGGDDVDKVDDKEGLDEGWSERENECAVAALWAEEYQRNPNAVVSCTYDAGPSETTTSATSTERRDSADLADTLER